MQYIEDIVIVERRSVIHAMQIPYLSRQQRQSNPNNHALGLHLCMCTRLLAFEQCLLPNIPIPFTKPLAWYFHSNKRKGLFIVGQKPPDGV
jgi:hypothetical protein